MRIIGSIQKSGKFWAIHCETMQANTQGKTKSEALLMMKDWVQSMLDDSEFEFDLEMDGKETFVMSFDDSEQIKKILGLVIQKNRNVAGKTLQDVATALGRNSTNSIHQYESGKNELKFSTVQEIVNSFGYEFEFSLKKKDAG